MSEKPSSMEKRLGVLERKLARERRAREAAEAQLERYSEQVFNTNLSLQRELAQSKKRQAELAFLGDTSAAAESGQSIAALLHNTMKLTTDLCAADIGLVMMSAHGHWLDSNRIRSKANAAMPQEQVIDFVQSTLSSSMNETLETWTIIPLDPLPGADWHRLLAANIELRDQHFAWLAFLVNSDEVDEETLFALDTALEHVRGQVGQRISEAQSAHHSEQLAHTLESAQKQLMHAEKMASLGQLAAGVAHEINNPVGFVYSNTDIMQEYLASVRAAVDALQNAFQAEQPLTRTHFENILTDHDVLFLLEDSDDMLRANLDGLKRIKDIVEGLKTFSHVGDDQFAEVNISEVITSALQVAGNALKHHRIHNAVNESAPPLLANAGQLQQVFVNLFVNAAHAMPDGGDLNIAAQHTSSHLTVTVSDSGCGMDEATRAKLFSPFFTTKPVGVGTGLGLSVSYSILEAHRAEIAVRSSPGKGTQFILDFPLPKPSAQI